MQIRKLFKFEMGHVVRKAYSRRCAKNIHGHSYLLEVFLKGNEVNDAQMVIDFGELKHKISDFIDSFDHAFCLRNIPEEAELIEFACKNFERVIVLPYNSTAEMMAKMFHDVIQKLMPEVTVLKCIVHETATGYAEYAREVTESIPETAFPIWIFGQFENVSKEILEFPNHIWFSKWIEDERKQTERLEKYNNSFIM